MSPPHFLVSVSSPDFIHLCSRGYPPSWPRGPSSQSRCQKSILHYHSSSRRQVTPGHAMGRGASCTLTRSSPSASIKPPLFSLQLLMVLNGSFANEGYRTYSTMLITSSLLANLTLETFSVSGVPAKLEKCEGPSY